MTPTLYQIMQAVREMPVRMMDDDGDGYGGIPFVSQDAVLLVVERALDAARVAVPDAATMARIYRVAPGEDSEGETWMAAYADLAAICAAEHAAVPDATAWRRTNEQEGHPDLPESLLYDPLSGDGDFQYLSLRAVLAELTAESVEDRLDRIAQHHESVGFHQGYAAARSERTAVPDARMLAEAMFNADPDAWKGRTDTDLLDDALDLAGELTRLAAPDATTILRNRVADSLVRADREQCWNCGCSNVSYWRYPTEDAARVAVPDTGLREAVERLHESAWRPNGRDADRTDLDRLADGSHSPVDNVDECRACRGFLVLAALPAPDPRP